MSSARATGDRPGPTWPMPAAAVVLLLLGLACLGGWRVASGTEQLPFAHDPSVPDTVAVRQGHTYALAVPGGVRAMLDRGLPTKAPEKDGTVRINLQCSYARPGDVAQPLPTTAESVATQAEDQIGTFVAPITGRLHVDCAGWGAVFVPDADDRSADVSGWLLLIATILLLTGAGLGLGAAYRFWSAGRWSRGAGEDDEVERLVDVAPSGRHDREVGRADRGDVPT